MVSYNIGYDRGHRRFSGYGYLIFDVEINGKKQTKKED